MTRIPHSLMLTPRQRDMLEYLNRYYAEHRCMPSFEEIKAGIGSRSKSSVHRLLTCLEERGCIRRIKDKSRAIELLRRPGAQRDSTQAMTESIERLAASYAAGSMERRDFYTAVLRVVGQYADHLGAVQRRAQPVQVAA